MFVATADYQCHQCQKLTKVVALGAPAMGRDTSADAMWPVFDEATGISYLKDLGQEAIEALKSTGCNIFIDHSFSVDEKYWMNHCSHCNAKIGDHYIHSSPGVAFFPTTEEEMNEVKIEAVARPLSADASPAMGVFARIVAKHL